MKHQRTHTRAQVHSCPHTHARAHIHMCTQPRCMYIDAHTHRRTSSSSMVSVLTSSSGRGVTTIPALSICRRRVQQQRQQQQQHKECRSAVAQRVWRGADTTGSGGPAGGGGGEGAACRVFQDTCMGHGTIHKHSTSAVLLSILFLCPFPRDSCMGRSATQAGRRVGRRVLQCTVMPCRTQTLLSAACIGQRQT